MAPGMLILLILIYTAIFLAVPYALVQFLALGLRRKDASKGAWLTFCVVSLLAFLFQYLLAIAAPFLISNSPNFAFYWREMGAVVVSLFWFLLAMLFPLLAGVGKKGWWKALLLVPILIFTLCMIFRYRMIVSASFLLYFPLLLALLLVFLWYLTGKNRVFGILAGLFSLGVLFVLPLLNIGYSLCLLWMDANLFRTTFQFITGVFSDPRTLIYQAQSLLASYAAPLPYYILLSQLAALALIGKKLPEGKTAAPAAAAPAEQPAPFAEPVRPTPFAEPVRPTPAAPQPPMQPKFCPQCGQPLPDGAKLCTQCGQSIG